MLILMKVTKLKILFCKPDGKHSLSVSIIQVLQQHYEAVITMFETCRVSSASDIITNKKIWLS